MESRDSPYFGLDDYLGLQRAGLEAAMALSTEAIGPLQQEIEQHYIEAKFHLQRCFNEENGRIEAEYREQRQLARQELERAVAQEQRRHESDLRSLDVHARTAQDFLSSDLDSARRQARKKHDDIVWEAQTVIKSTLAGLQKEFQVTQQRLAGLRLELDSLRIEADRVRSQQGSLLPVLPPPAPTSSPAAAADLPENADLAALFDEQAAAAGDCIRRLGDLTLPKLITGVRPYLAALVVGLAAGCAAALLAALGWAYASPVGIIAPLAGVLAAGLVAAATPSLRRRARDQVQDLDRRLQAALGLAETALQRSDHLARRQLQREEAQALADRDQDLAGAREHLDHAAGRLAEREKHSLGKIEVAVPRLQDEVEQRHENQAARIDEAARKRDRELQQQRDRQLLAIRARHDQELAASQARRDQGLSALRAGWIEQLARIGVLLQAARAIDRSSAAAAAAPPPSTGGSALQLIKVGRISVDLARLAPAVRALPEFSQLGAAPQAVPMALSIPHHGSLLVQTASEGREQAIALLRSVMVNLLTSLAPGRVRFTIVDPVGLGRSFAGFMHLADYEATLVGTRIWTEAADVEQRLAELTDHMENVIQKYLRNEFASIEEYNRQAAALAEPYRFLVIADFPVNFSDEAGKRLVRILAAGPRCGVYALVAWDRRHRLPPGLSAEELASQCIHLAWRPDGRFSWQDEVRRHFPVELAPALGDERLTALMHEIGQRARQAMRVEVPFERVAPPAGQEWSLTCDTELSVAIGLAGGTRRQMLRLGQGVAQHALLAGKTGSGKSTLLHILITNLALWYRPDEVEMYLVDFKKGVEFKTYATFQLPHARAIAIESDREFGLSVLARLDQELQRRGDLFRQLGVQDLAAYRREARQALPRTLLIVDEFQVLFAEDDKLAQDAAILLDRLVRQGRAFGIHVLLGSQTLGGTSRLPRSTMGQMAVRVALQCSEADSLLILDETNGAARGLTRPGEAIYNDAGGMAEGNEHFQIAWQSDEEREAELRRVRQLVQRAGLTPPAAVVFEGNAPADATSNLRLAELLATPAWLDPPSPRVWLGAAVAIKEPTGLVLARQGGAHLLLVGQEDEAALGMMAAAVVALAAQHSPARARFVIFDGSPADSPQAGRLERVAAALPHSVRVVPWREVETAVADLASELATRQGPGQGPGAEAGSGPNIYIIIYGAQRFRVLRRREEELSFSASAAGSAPAADKQLADLLRDGPPLGLHLLLWADSYATLERTFDRRSLGEFDHRVLFQMGAGDSSNLIDSPAANRLGLNRALFYSEQQGVLEKFRPYAWPGEEWLGKVAEWLGKKG